MVCRELQKLDQDIHHKLEPITYDDNDNNNNDDNESDDNKENND